MDDHTGSLKKTGCFRWLFFLGGLIWFLYYAGKESWLLLHSLLSVIINLAFWPFGLPPVNLPPLGEIANAIVVLVLYGVGLGLAFLLPLFVFSQFVLPARTLQERFLAVLQVLLNSTPWPGQFARVQEGGLVDQRHEEAYEPGAILADTTSAVVLERRWMAMPIWLRPVPRPYRRRPRIEGPGPIFTNWYEHVRGAVNLRKQFRASSRDVVVKGYTSDGIEVSTSVFAVFTLGQPAKVLKVARLGPNSEHLRVLQLDEESWKVKAILDDLDEDDKQEICQFACQLRVFPAQSTPPAPEDAFSDCPPLPVDKERIFAAIYSQAEDVHNHEAVEWSEAPVLAAIDIFRNIISHYTFDDLFINDSSVKTFPQGNARQRFAREMRNLGVLSYQYIQPLHRGEIRVGDQLTPDQFFVSPVQKLTNHKVLRERGIKVIHSGFMDLNVAHEVSQQRLENWKAKWQSDIDQILADSDREIILVRNRAKAEAQRKMIFSLSEIFRSTQYSEEALAIDLFSALETVAADPTTRHLLPGDTIRMLRTLRSWLLPGEDEQADMIVDNSLDFEQP